MYRAIVLGFILIPVNAYWVIQTEFLRDYGFTIPTGISLFFNVVFILCILVLINALIKKVYPKLALRSGELLLNEHRKKPLDFPPAVKPYVQHF